MRLWPADSRPELLYGSAVREQAVGFHSSYVPAGKSHLCGQSQTHIAPPSSLPLLSMEEKPGVRLLLTQSCQHIWLVGEMGSAGKDHLLLWKTKSPYQKAPAHTPAGQWGCLLGGITIVTVLSCTDLLELLSGTQHLLSALPYGMRCVPQLVPNYSVSGRFYCNLLCLVYFKVAKGFHKERTVRLPRRKTLGNLLFLCACFGKHLMVFAYSWSRVSR